MKMNKKMILFLGAGLLLATCLTVYHRYFTSQARIKSVMDRTAGSFLQKDRALILSNIDEEFLQGQITKDKADTALMLFFREFDRVKVTIDDQKVMVNDDEAVDTIRVIMVVSRRGEQGFLLGSFGNPYPLAVKFKPRDKWRITGVEGLPGY